MLDLEFPLAFGQERVWFLQKLDPGDRSYQFQATLTFEGALDVRALERALQTIVARHSIFRTTFPSIAGAPVQRICSQASPAFAMVDAASDAALAGAIAGALAATFDVARLPLVRWTLVRVSQTRHVLVHVEHHLVHDGWSFNVFLDELAQLYRGFVAGSDVRLEAAPAFGDFARRQRELAQTPEAAAQLAYWKRTLSGAPALLNLPTDKLRPPVSSHCGDALVAELPQKLVRGIERLGRQHAATPFMTMLAAFAVLLGRYSGDADICVGTGMAGRDTPDLERLIGMLVNTVVLRLDLSGDPTFLELLERTKSVAFDAYANQNTSFERVVEALAPVRDASFNPLFAVLFSFHDSQQPALDFGSLVAATLDQTTNNASAKLDLNVVCIPHPAGMTLKWEFDSALFERATMSRMLAHFECLLERILAEPERRISRFELVRERERRLVLEEFAENRQPYPRDGTLDALFAARAAATPNARALCAEGDAPSYAELEQRANRLARYLQRRGVRSATRVALFLERSADAIVAMLAVLKCGAAYVPLDARSPRERLAWLLEDAAVALTLTHRDLHERLPSATPILALDRHADDIAAEEPGPLAGTTEPEALAYVMYTSGSTGLPKGVCVTHRGVVRLVTSGGPIAIRADDVVLQYASHAFDAATYEIWGALLNGATLVLPPSGTLSLAELGEALRRLHATVALLTTPLFHQMVESRPADLQRLRLLVVGGDVLSPVHARRFVEDAAGCRLINGYGPTENTTFTTVHEVSSSVAERKSTPIGRPVGNTSVYVLDSREAPVAIDVPGEIWTGGDGVARGYLKRPELTAERFVPDPFSQEPGARLYRTGDLGRWRADGTLEFLGRNDDQVKIRGFRIELGSVENALRRHPAVREAAVSVVGGGQGAERMLVGYVVLQPGALTDARDIRTFAATQVPDYEVPSRIVAVAALPASTGGKIDRAALAQHAVAPPEPLDGRLRGAVEERLAEIWKHVLNVPSVARNDDFFDLGGHSLMAMRVLARLNEAFAVELSLRELFERPTLAALAEAVERAPRTVRAAPPTALDVAALSDAEIEALLNEEFAGVTTGFE